MKSNLQTVDDSPFLFISGRLCLDFVNTEIIRAGQWTDLIQEWSAFTAWLSEAGLMLKRASDTKARQEEQAAAVKTGLSLRTALRAMAQALSEGKIVPQSSLDVINAFLAQNPGTQQIVRDDQTDSFRVRLVNEGVGVAALLGPIAQDAVDILCSGEHACVRQCEDTQCILFFYDTTKNHGRRWCRMNACGNRAKAAAHYLRRKQQK